MNSGTLLEEWQKKCITVHAFGPEKLIPEDYFKSAKTMSVKGILSPFSPML